MFQNFFKVRYLKISLKFLRIQNSFWFKVLFWSFSKIFMKVEAFPKFLWKLKLSKIIMKVSPFLIESSLEFIRSSFVIFTKIS